MYGHIFVNLLGDKGNERMQQLQNGVEAIIESRRRGNFCLLVASVQNGLGKLDVPVAELAPHKIVNNSRRNAKLVFANFR